MSFSFDSAVAGLVSSSPVDFFTSIDGQIGVGWIVTYALRNHFVMVWFITFTVDSRYLKHQ